MPLKTTLLLSASLHALLVLLFTSQKEREKSSSVYSLEIIENRGDQIKISKARSRASKRSSHRPPAFMTFKNKLRYGAEAEKVASENGTGWGEGEFGSGGENFEYLADSTAFRIIAQEITGLLYYPGPLAEKEFEGGVNVRLPFLKAGGCDQKRIRLYYGTRYFNVYITKLIQKLCALEQIQELQLEKARHVDLTFVFSIVDAARYQPAPPPHINGNVLLFQRQIPKMVGEIKLGPVILYGPYISVDFPYIFDKWNKLTNGKDPLDEFREK